MTDRAVGPGVHLLWIPLGAGASVPLVQWNGRAYEAISAMRQHRRQQDLYHAALELGASEGRFVIEMTPAWGAAHCARGSVASGPVGWRPLGRSRFFRYEVHCWRDGVIPDKDRAVGGPHLLTSDIEVADRILDLVPAFPAHVWGRDECGTGDMWNSNSLVAWLLARAELRAEQIPPPPHGRAPGWRAGLVVAATVPLVTYRWDPARRAGR